MADSYDGTDRPSTSRAYHKNGKKVTRGSIPESSTSKSDNIGEIITPIGGASTSKGADRATDTRYIVKTKQTESEAQTSDNSEPWPAKRRKKSGGFKFDPRPGTRTGLRSQARQVATSSAGTDPRWVVKSATITSPTGGSASTSATSSTVVRQRKAPGASTSKQSNIDKKDTVGPVDLSQIESATAKVESITSVTEQTSSAQSQSSSKSSTQTPKSKGKRKKNPQNQEKLPTVVQKKASRKRTQGVQSQGSATASTSSTSEPVNRRKKISKNNPQQSSTAGTSRDRREPATATTGEASSRLKRSVGGQAGGGQTGGESNNTSRPSGSTGSCASASSRRRSGARGSESVPLPQPVASSSSAAAGASAAALLAATDMSSDEGAAGGSKPTDGAAKEMTEPKSGAELLTAALRSESERGASAASLEQAAAAAAADPEMHRLQAMLEARGLPPHIFGALGSSMRHILHRSMNSGTMGKVQQLLKGMQAKEDEGQQLTALMEMCQVLVMGNEDSLAGFPIKQVVPELVSLLHMEHNFEIMNHACRALTYMLEALPRSSPVVVEAVPALLDKLKCIQCMDVAEQSLSALEMLSKKHNKSLLQAGAISACLMFLDFFSTVAQRSALSVAANCCLNMTVDEFSSVRESLPLLSARLLISDKKSVESVCTCFARLVDNYAHDEKILKELAAHEMLGNMLKLLVVSPSALTSNLFTMVMRMFVVMCTNCPELAVCLLRQKVADTLVFLLVGSPGAAKQIELIPRSPQELFEIVSLIGELMPGLPSTGLFSVNALLRKHPSLAHGEEENIWQWKDDKGAWKNYNPMDSRIIEAAYQATEEEVTLSTLGRMYTIDFTMMQQINEETGNARPVHRAPNLQASKKSSSASTPKISEKSDTRADVLAEQPELATDFIKSLFAILYEVYSSSAGPAVRHKCLQALLRQIYYAAPNLLSEVLINQPVSSHIASMLGSQDFKVVVGALQMADILMHKLPEVFKEYFQRQGVTHQIKLLATSGANRTTSAEHISETAETSSSDSLKNISLSKEEIPSPSSPGPAPSGVSPTIKYKRPNKRALRSNKSKGSAEGETAGGDEGRSTRGKHPSKKDPRQPPGASNKSTKSSFLASLHPSKWGRSSEKQSTSDSRGQNTASLITIYKEKVGTWIAQQSLQFMNEHFSQLNPNGQSPEGILNTLCEAAAKLDGMSRGDNPDQVSDREALNTIAKVVQHEDVSPFEMIHSGVIKKLHDYLTLSPELASTSSSTTDSLLPRDLRLTTFMNVFIGTPAQPGAICTQQQLTAGDSALPYLVSKTLACLHQQEQFQVKVHDLGVGGNSNSNAMKIFSSHQLKCQLQRHPDCKTLQQWKGGPVKVDPLALVQAIERYLIIRGFCKAKPEGDEDTMSDEAESDDELDDSMAAMLMAQSSGKHKLEFVIGTKVLSYNMTVYQAVRNHAPMDGPSDTDTDVESGLGNASIWSQTHVIWYRPAPDGTPGSTKTPSSAFKKIKADGSSKSAKSGGKVKKNDDFWHDGTVPKPVPPMKPYLIRSLTERVTVNDPSLDTLALIRVLHAINKHWGSLYNISSYKTLIPLSEFISSKLTAKANRQLQDPLVIMTGNLPQWLPQVASVCPFLFPFDTRQMLFYSVAFDRDRAMMRLQESSADGNDMDSSRVAPPRLERKRKIVNRDNLFRQAEKIFDDVGNCKSLIEIQYDNEVGTGLGPTLEFYSLVSREFQQTSLDLWYGTSASVQGKDGQVKRYMTVGTGLYPKPLARSTKPNAVTKIKAKFRFLGKFLAKSLMDSRILDLPLNPVIYHWLLGQEKTLSSMDLVSFDPSIAKSYEELKVMSQKVADINANMELSASEKENEIASLGIDDLYLDFTWPGSNHIQLRKNGKDEPVTAANIHLYLELLLHWILHEGISKQLEALKEGFDSVFPSASLKDLFYPDELEQLFCGNKSAPWDTKDLYDCCRADHGYTMDSTAVQFLFDVLSSYDSEQQRQFLSFVTGAPNLPVGGFRSLNPPLTIVRKTFEASENADEFLPSVMTCVNYLKLPDYSSMEIMREKLDKAATIGQLSFHLS